MKESGSVFGWMAGKTYSAVNTGNNASSSGQKSLGLQRKSSVFVNQFFKETGSAKNKRVRPRCSFVLMAIGVVSLISAVVVLIARPYDLIFRLKVKFSPGGETYELWRKPPVDLYLRIYLYNVTNKDEFLAGKEKLRVQETGPYVYKELIEHSNVTFNSNGTMTSIPVHPLVWIPELSNGTQEDVLILPNIALLSIAEVVKDKTFFARMGLNIIARQTDSQALVSMTAKEFMYGYESPLVKLGNRFLPSWINFEKLGLIDRMYNFEGDVATFFTGETDVRKSGLLERYRGLDYLPHWDGDYCSRLSGASDATKFSSLIEKNETLYFYRKSVCRTMPAMYTGEVANIRGLNAYKYKFPENTLDNGAVRPENKCFCRNGKCLPAGLIDVHECYYGFPIAVSYPHFYEADPSLVEAIDGSNPQKEKHESYVYVEPKSGLPLDVSFRFQINLALGDISGITRAAPFKNLVVPMLWTEIVMPQLPDDLNNRFILYLNVLPILEKVIMYFLFCFGIAFLAGSMSRVMFLNWDLQKKSKNMDFSHGNAEELKRIHKQNMKKHDNKPINEKTKEAEAYYSSLLAPSQEEASEDCQSSKEREMTLLRMDTEEYVSPRLPMSGMDNYSCNERDDPETPPPRYDHVNFLSLKEDAV